MGIKSLYMNIPNSNQIFLVHVIYESYPQKSIVTKVINIFLALILLLNNYMFSCTNYLQMRHCTMGTACTISYANIFLKRFEEKHFNHLLKTN